MEKKKIKIKYTCSNNLNHQHRWKWTAWLCGRIQALIAHKVYFKPNVGVQVFNLEQGKFYLIYLSEPTNMSTINHLIWRLSKRGINAVVVSSEGK